MNDSELLVCLPYWDGDWPRMREVALLLADLLPEKSTRTKLLFVLRHDVSKAPDSRLHERCADKFAEVRYYRNKRRGVGWPMGCNEMAFGIFDHVYCRHSLFPKVDSLLIVESDCVMLRRTWDRDLHQAWHETQKAGKLICGTKIPTGFQECKFHINAVALYSWDIIQKLPQLIGSPGTVGWDYFHGKITCPVAVNTPLIKMDYNRDTISEQELFSKKNKSVVLYHGVKDDSAVKAVRSQLKV